MSLNQLTVKHFKVSTFQPMINEQDLISEIAYN